MKIENIIRYTERAVGLMEIENLIRYPALAVGLKPSVSQGEARLRGLWRNNYSKTISRGWQAGSPPARACQQAASAAFALLVEPFRATARRGAHGD